MSNGPATRQRAVRQEALREWLSKKCTAQHLVDNLNKIENLDCDADNFNNKLNKYKVANEQRFKVLDKYLPSLKSTEITGEGGGAVSHELWLEKLVDEE
jgi:hypothetical protein